MKAKISDHLNYKTMFKLTIMPILMNVFMSMYSIIDGTCIAALGSADGFAGVNLIMPIIIIVGGIGFIFGTGGCALSAKYLGEKNQEKANSVFTMLLVVTIFLGLIFSTLGSLVVKPIVQAMASVTPDSTEGMVKEATKYGQVLMLGQTFFMIQSFFQAYFLVAEKSNIGFKFTLGAGITNISLDLLFIGVFKWGVIGAAVATIIGQMFASVGPFIYFVKHKNARIRLSKFKLDFKDIGKAAFNGSSEFVNNVSAAVVGVIMNLQLLRYYGQIGVSSYGALMYVSMIFIFIFFGFSTGISPAVSYQFGAKNTKELSIILKRSSFVIGIISVLMFLLGILLARPLAVLFCSGNMEIADLTTLAMTIFSFSYLLSGFGIFSSTFFTALNNGLISAIISFFRALVFQILFAYTLPILFGPEGIWYAMIFAEIGSFILSISFLIGNKNKYHYFEKCSLF